MRTVYILPNLMTLGNLFCGLNSIYFAIQGRPLYAVYMVLGAMVFDFLDGEIARLTKTKSEFGLQFDSLSDLVSFGIAPAVLIYTLFTRELMKLGWLFGLLYTICSVLRLARHNVLAKEKEKGYFYGLPIPTAAGLVVSYVLIYLYVERAFILTFMPLVMICAAFLMVSNIKYSGFQKIDLKIRIPFALLIFGTFAATVYFRNLYYILFLCFTGYTLAGIFFEIKKRVSLPRQEKTL